MSSKKNQFTSASLNQLINEAIAEADEVTSDLNGLSGEQFAITETDDPISDDNALVNNDNYDDYLAESDKTWSEADGVVNKETGESVSFNYVYKKIAALIDNGNTALEMLQSIDLDVADPALLNAAGSLINVIRGCISEFTKIHLRWIKFNQAMRMEDKRFENKMKLMKYRNDLINGKQDEQSQISQLFELKSADLVEFLQWKKEKEAREQEQKEKI